MNKVLRYWKSKLKAYLVLFILMQLSVVSLASSNYGLEYSYRTYPEITELLNEDSQGGSCDTYVDSEFLNDPVTLLGKQASIEFYLVHYIDDCGTSGREGISIISKEGTDYRKSDIRPPSPSKVEIEGVKYELYESRTEFQADTYSAYYDIACLEGDDYRFVGSCASGTSYKITLNYTFSNDESGFQLVSKTAEPNE